MKTIGIIGGMGPLATAELFKAIICFTDAKSDNEHIPILVDNNTRIPDRTAAIVCGGEDPRPELIRSARRLEQAGADFLIMPCNTAHYFIRDVEKAVSIMFINMIEETVREARQSGYQTLGVLSTEGTLQSGVYERAIESAGMRMIKPNDTEQKDVTATIYEGVKAGNFELDATGFKSVIKRLYEDGAQTLVLGCTELPIAFRAFGIEGETLDPSCVLAKRAIERAGAKTKPK